MGISIVIPTYNERENVQRLIPLIARYFDQKKMGYEMIIVDDDSSDGTANAALELGKKKSNVRVISREKKNGIGDALREGYDSAKEEFILSMDADLEFNEKDFDRLLEKMSEGNDIVVGAKYNPKSTLERPTPLEKFQTIVSWAGSQYMKTITGIPINDFSMNFRMLRKSTWKELHSQQNGNFFLAECIFQAHQKGFKIAEIPFHFTARKTGASKTRLWKQSGVFLRETLKYHRFASNKIIAPQKALSNKTSAYAEMKTQSIQEE